MHHTPPPEDFLVIHCKGRCGKWFTVTFPQLYQRLVDSGIKSVTEFRNTFVCNECEARFIILIEAKKEEP